VTLPGADELFRATSPATSAAAAAGDGQAAAPVRRLHDDDVQGQRSVLEDELVAAVSAPAAARSVRQTARRQSRSAQRQPTGRERHDEKITVYVSADELLDLERARLVLRGEHGLAVDRGRIVREAVAVVLADLEAKGQSSILVRRLLGI
jgi:hypothetical protein